MIELPDLTTETGDQQPEPEFQVGDFTITVLYSKHSPPTPLNDDIGHSITEPVVQPASTIEDYKEGGSYDILIRHGENTILVKGSANYIEGKLDGVQADVLFLGTATLGAQPDDFRDDFYRNTVEAVKPSLVVPIHWDNFIGVPLSDNLPALEDLSRSFGYMIDRMTPEGIRFGILQGKQSVMLFGDE